jgi:ketosteroid isomerase-like protein
MDTSEIDGAMAAVTRTGVVETRPRASEAGTDIERIHDFLGRWTEALNSHDLDELDALVCEDVIWVDPAMFGDAVHGRAEVRAFHETLLRAFPDVCFHRVSTPYAALDGDGVAQRWRMTGTFTGDLRLWGAGVGEKAAAYAPNRRRLDLEIVSLYEFRAGFVSRWVIHYDLLDFSQQIGILPPRDSRMVPLMVRAQRLVASVQRRQTSARPRG